MTHGALLTGNIYQTYPLSSRAPARVRTYRNEEVTNQFEALMNSHLSRLGRFTFQKIQNSPGRRRGFVSIESSLAKKTHRADTPKISTILKLNK